MGDRHHEYDDSLDDDCWNCGGEGFVYDCVSDYACIDPEGGCDLCMRRCDVCRPRPVNAEPAEALPSPLTKDHQS